MMSPNLQRWRWIPNGLTFLRILLVAPFAYFLFDGQYRPALALFVVASLTDGLDGLLARVFDWKSRLGAIADPLADKLLMVTAYLTLSVTGVLPLWLFAVVLGRDLLIVGGGLLFHHVIGRFEIQPSALGKLNTLVQIVAALVVMVVQAGYPMPAAAVGIAIWSVALTALISGLHYVVIWGRRAREGRKA